MKGDGCYFRSNSVSEPELLTEEIEKKYYINTKLCCVRVENEQWCVDASKVDGIRGIDYF